MTDQQNVSQHDRVMTPEIAALIVDLTRRLDSAYQELDDAAADAHAIREQRAILSHQRHEDTKTITRQHARIAALCDENRELRQQAAAWARMAA